MFLGRLLNPEWMFALQRALFVPIDVHSASVRTARPVPRHTAAPPCLYVPVPAVPFPLGKQFCQGIRARRGRQQLLHGGELCRTAWNDPSPGTAFSAISLHHPPHAHSKNHHDFILSLQYPYVIAGRGGAGISMRATCLSAAPQLSWAEVNIQ